MKNDSHIVKALSFKILLITEEKRITLQRRNRTYSRGSKLILQLVGQIRTGYYFIECSEKSRIFFYSAKTI